MILFCFKKQMWGKERKYHVPPSKYMYVPYASKYVTYLQGI